MRLYRIKHDGKFPSLLNELVPDYLKSIPADPMASSRTLSYFDGKPNAPAHANDPIIYSVGDNGTDEGGSERIAYGWPDGTVMRRQAEDIVVHLTPQPRKPDPDADDAPAQTPEPAPGTTASGHPQGQFYRAWPGEIPAHASSPVASRNAR